MPAPLFCTVYPTWRACSHPTGHSSHRTHLTNAKDIKYLGLSQNFEPYVFVPHVARISVEIFQIWYAVANTSWPRLLRDPISASFIKFWDAILLLITGKPGFVPYPLPNQFKSLWMSPTSSCARALFPLWDSCILSVSVDWMLNRSSHD